VELYVYSPSRLRGADRDNLAFFTRKIQLPFLHKGLGVASSERRTLSYKGSEDPSKIHNVQLRDNRFDTAISCRLNPIIRFCNGIKYYISLRQTQRSKENRIKINQLLYISGIS